MGTWGHGLQENDNAGDAIFEVLRAGRSPMFDWMLRQRGKINYAGNRQAILGVAEFLSHHGVKFPSKVRGFLRQVVSIELQPEELKERRSPKKRKEAIKSFVRSAKL